MANAPYGPLPPPAAPTRDAVVSPFGFGQAKAPPTPSLTPAADRLRAFYAPLFAPPKPGVDVQQEATQAAQKISPSPFLQNLGKSLTQGATALGGAADQFVAKQAQNVKDFVAGKLRVTPDDVVKGLGSTALGAIKTTGSLAQGFNQGILRIGKSGAEAVLPGYKQAVMPKVVAQDLNEQAAQDQITKMSKSDPNSEYKAVPDPVNPNLFHIVSQPKSDLLNSLTGSPTLESYQDAFHAIDLWSKTKGATDHEAKTAAGFGVLGMMFADNPLIGPEGEAAKGIALSTKGIDALTKASTEDAAKTILQKEAPHLSEDLVNFLAPAYQGAKTPEEVKNITAMANRAAEQAAMKTGPQREIAPLAEDRIGEPNKMVGDNAVDNAAKDFTYEPTHEESFAQMADTAARPTETKIPEEVKAEAHVVPEDLKPLASEAKTYRSVEEFAASLSPEQTQAIHSAAGHETGNFADLADKGMKYTYKPTDEPITVYRGMPEGKTNLRHGDYVTLNKAEAKNYGPSVQQFTVPGNQLRVASKTSVPKSLIFYSDKPSTAVTDFYHAATQAEKVPLEAPKASTHQFSPNLVRALGAEKDPYRVLQIVQKEFPHLQGSMLDRVAERFTQLKNTQTIDSMLQAAKNLDERFAHESTPRVMLPRDGGEAIKETVPKPLRGLMTQDQKFTYVDALRRKFGAKVDDEGGRAAVTAEREYNRIWDAINQGTIEKHEELKLQHALITDAISQDPAAPLLKRYYAFGRSPSDSAYNLHEIHLRAVDRASKGRLSGVPVPETHATRLDTAIEEMGFHDFEHAQTALERLAELRTQAQEVKAEIKKLDPLVKEAKLLQTVLDDVAVIPQQHVSAIDKLAKPDLVRDTYKDISGANAGNRDLWRNFREFFGSKYEDAKKAILDPFDDAKGKFIDDIGTLSKDLKENVTNKYDIKRGSKESGLIQQFGEGKISKDEIVQQVGREKADQIEEAAAWFHHQYDSLIDSLNETRRRIYPNSPNKLIAKRKDYFRHFQEVGQDFQSALREFFETPSGIDPNLAGLSEFTQAKSRFLPFAQERKGDKTVVDAVGGFLDYAPMWSYAQNIDPQIQSFRYLRRKIAESAPRAGEDMKLPNGKTFKHKGVENFLGFLDDFQRDLTGNTNPMDRWIQKRIPGGRKTIRAGRFLNSRMKANTVSTLSSAIAQATAIPAVIADTKLNAIKGMQRTLAGFFAKNEPMEASTFLKERYASRLHEDFPVSFKDKPITAASDEAKKGVNLVIGAIEEASTRMAWNSYYEKGLAKRVAEPIRYADEQTRLMAGGRGIGEVPLDQKALVTGFVAPFTLEVMNSWHWYADKVKAKEFWSTLVPFFAANYLFNEAMQDVRGSRVTYDPVNALIQGSQMLAHEWEAGNPLRGLLLAAGRQAGEVIQNVPAGQTFAAVIPDAAVQSVTGGIKKDELFGGQVTSRFGTPLIISNLLDPSQAFTRIFLPTGGRQVEKTFEAIKTLATGAAEDSKGHATYSVTPTPVNILQALAFGSGATPEAQKYFLQRNDLFTLKNRASAEGVQAAAQAEKEWAKIKDIKTKKGGDAAAAELQKTIKDNPALATKIVSIADDEAAGLNGNERLIKQFGVKDGSRAKYISDQLKKMKTGDEKAAYVKELASKKLLPAEVVDQITALISAPGNKKSFLGVPGL
jgi:hypothetical protein